MFTSGQEFAIEIEENFIFFVCFLFHLELGIFEKIHLFTSSGRVFSQSLAESTLDVWRMKSKTQHSSARETLTRYSRRRCCVSIELLLDLHTC